LITLTFSPLSAGSQILVRGTFFRICADSTLRGPESTLVATYAAHLWRVGLRACRDFHCDDSLLLRVRNPEGDQEELGPYQFLRVAEGALFASGKCLGMYSSRWNVESSIHRWDEITLLAAPTH
jgi:hypothetical protein